MILKSPRHCEELPTITSLRGAGSLMQRAAVMLVATKQSKSETTRDRLLRRYLSVQRLVASKLTLLAMTGMLLATIATAQVRLPKLIRDSMILQRDASVNIWGWSAPNEKVS